MLPHQCVFRWFSERPGDCHTSAAALVRNDTFYSGAPASAMPYVIRRTLKKVSYNSLKYFARGETTKFIHPILWEMTFFAPEP